MSGYRRHELQHGRLEFHRPEIGRGRQSQSPARQSSERAGLVLDLPELRKQRSAMLPVKRARFGQVALA